MPFGKLIDIPPVYLAIAAVVLWGEVQLTGGLGTGALGLWIGRGLVAAGLVLMAAAIWSFAKARTSPVPHMMPSAMITTGVFRLTRNPIYLGDTLVLLGLGVQWGAISLLVVVPLFVVWIDRRFICAEEARLRSEFPDDWPAYRDRVPRWIGPA